MKVQCDVCGRRAAAVFCCPDEAALCTACDCRVHRANKLAGQHCRLDLIAPGNSPGSAQAPVCDVCQERRGIIFCVEDRAILCSECDEPIHGANELTKKHNRFLLVGVRVSATPAAAPASCSEDSSDSSPPEVEKFAANAAAKKGHQDEALVSEKEVYNVTTAVAGNSNVSVSSSNSSGSSISEYLTQVCPGWRLEDVLIDDAAIAAAAAVPGKEKQQQLLPFVDAEFDNGFSGVTMSPAPELSSMWVPHVPQDPMAASRSPSYWVDVSGPSPIAASTTVKAGGGNGREPWTPVEADHDVFAVPEMYTCGKRARPNSFWYY